MNHEPNHSILKIDINPISVRVISDIYITFYRMKYIPTIDLMDLKSKRLFSIFIGASSFAKKLEEFREESNNIIDYEFWIQKDGDDKFSKFIITKK